MLSGEKFPLLAGIVALVFAVGALFGIKGLGAGVVAFGAANSPRVTDFVFWVGVTSTCLVSSLALAADISHCRRRKSKYSSVLQKQLRACGVVSFQLGLPR